MKKKNLGQGHMTWPWHDLGDLDLIFFLMCINLHMKKKLGQGHMTWPRHDLGDLDLSFFLICNNLDMKKKFWSRSHDLTLTWPWWPWPIFFLMCINSKVKGQVRSCDHDLYDIEYESPICEWSRARAVQYAVHPSFILFWQVYSLVIKHI